MILPDFILPTQQNQRWTESGPDSLDRCLDKKHFKSYPYPIEYRYNSRGYRDAEWPKNVSELKNAIWCFGDSFTVGIGSPLAHTWAHLLQQHTKKRVINISMDGASNEWMSRKVDMLLKIINPENIVIHWSYIERRENISNNNLLNRYWVDHYENIKGPDWPIRPLLENYNTLPGWILKELAQHDQSWKNGLTDDKLKLGHIKSTWDEDIANTLNCINQVNASRPISKNIIHSFIPEIVPKSYTLLFEEQLKNQDFNYIPLFDKLDLARDGHHYDVLTSQFLVDQIIPLLY